MDVGALREQAAAWLAADPDDGDRAELRKVLDGLPDTAAELADRFAGHLTFGTDGLRGPLRAGPNGMNRAVVRAAAAGLVRWLARSGAPGPVVLGYDARYRSREFAEETARVVTGAGREALVLPGPLPTPVLAFAVRRLSAVAGVMVTASHNPPRDNGYKVYLGAALGGDIGAGAQIVPPADVEIEAAIRAVGRLADVPLGPPGAVLGQDLTQSYVDSVAGWWTATRTGSWPSRTRRCTGSPGRYCARPCAPPDSPLRPLWTVRPRPTRTSPPSRSP